MTTFCRPGPLTAATLASLATSFAACTLALAQPAPPAEPTAVPPLHGEGSARYRCGGIGIDESTAFRAATRQHPLSLLFAAPGGDYQANVTVRISDAKGNQALQLRADGPVCLIDLPNGSYTVEATPEKGAPQKRSVQVTSGRPQTLDFRF
ncbi:carboxypeptidase regulatory-like domain-containing protein [Xylophilus sp.]|uniref:carboxypeptidase regulatory-like domain-containing protein n=1 Tax=Xylophilus sp. TaxID=2653893 RepID=UPI0013B98090|nr:carboxypeptidase regulatory-like domain-containing protein [Xylophilus sp.]KAF1050295.1 MAG: hypothetical protein GAK38_00321 [Xylophilus sp.]